MRMNTDLGTILPEVISRNSQVRKTSSLKSNISKQKNYSKYLKQIQKELINTDTKVNHFKKDLSPKILSNRVNFNQEAYKKNLLREINREIDMNPCT